MVEPKPNRYYSVTPTPNGELIIEDVKNPANKSFTVPSNLKKDAMNFLTPTERKQIIDGFSVERTFTGETLDKLEHLWEFTMNPKTSKEPELKQRKSRKKKIPKETPVTPLKSEYGLVLKLIKEDGDINTLEILKHDLHTFELSDKEFRALSKLLDDKLKEERAKIPLGTIKARREVTPIITSAEVTRRREEKEKPKILKAPPEEVGRYTPIIHVVERLDVRNADAWLKKYKRYIPQMVQLGLRNWLDQHPEAESFPLTSTSIDQIVKRLDLKYIGLDPLTHPPGREVEAVRFLRTMRYALMHAGLEDAMERYDWDRWYEPNSSQMGKEEFVKVVIGSVRKVIPMIYKV